MDLFTETGEQLKRDGIEAVSIRNEVWLEKMRGYARHVATQYGDVTSDNLHIYALSIGEPSHPNAYGAILNTRDFEPVGYRPSSRPEAHSRIIRVWRLKGTRCG
jgi:hypothetical protein